MRDATLSLRLTFTSSLFVSTGDSSALCLLIQGLLSDLQANVSRAEWLRVKEVFRHTFLTSQDQIHPKKLSFKGSLVSKNVFLICLQQQLVVSRAFPDSLLQQCYMHAPCLFAAQKYTLDSACMEEAGITSSIMRAFWMKGFSLVTSATLGLICGS